MFAKQKHDKNFVHTIKRGLAGGLVFNKKNNILFLNAIS
jgi:hypothetical protein